MQHPNDGGHATRQTVTPDAVIRERARHSAAMSAPVPASAPALLTDKQCAALLGVSERKFHELRPLLCKAVVLGPRCVRWIRSELEQAILALPRQEQVTAPAQLARARIERMKAVSMARAGS